MESVKLEPTFVLSFVTVLLGKPFTMLRYKMMCIRSGDERKMLRTADIIKSQKYNEY
jgi:hypothetical protein